LSHAVRQVSRDPDNLPVFFTWINRLWKNQKPIADHIASEYYNNPDADLYYRVIRGGEDIHVGLYESDNDRIAVASLRTVVRMMDLAGTLTLQSLMIDQGSGYGGSMCYIAKPSGAHCLALNASDVENERT